LGAVICFGTGGGGGWDLDPCDVDMDDDELSWVEGIIVPGLRFLEKVEDFCGADIGGATTATSREGDDTDDLRSVRRRLA
jgi:hypothetical protein